MRKEICLFYESISFSELPVATLQTSKDLIMFHLSEAGVMFRINLRYLVNLLVEVKDPSDLNEEK